MKARKEWWKITALLKRNTLVGTFLYAIERSCPYWFTLIVYIPLFGFTLLARPGRGVEGG